MNKESFIEVGKAYFIRTITMHILGRVKAINEEEFLVEKASWVADSGRFYDALKTGKLNEVEPFIDDVIIGRGSLIDATLWQHDLPEKQK